ncbi:MAG TPA: ATP-dependent helicase HrpB [Nitriliruptoraceae bacterium]|nr:ATP-dependent helicase HrpB [Nitriliruptoraceae bacterium]
MSPAPPRPRPDRDDLPIDDVLDDIAGGGATVIVEAPPGAGKTTRVPPRLLDEVDGRVVVLEPRRVAARAAARRMASEAGGTVGDLVGVTTRDDRRTSRATRIEVVTEGVLVNRLLRDASLDGVGAIVLDEFHERSLDADLALAFTREVQQVLRPDLRIVVMSATLDQAALATILPDATVVSSAGRLHDVQVRWRARTSTDALPHDLAAAVAEALATTDGSVLVFVPGWREIRATISAIDAPPDTDVVALHGSMTAREQDAALAPSSPGRRRVVVATDVAESSLTVPGITAVVDSGLVRQPQLDARTGLTRLVTVPTSQASARQRSGRAGRLGPGVAIRIGSGAQRRPAQPTPAIDQVDLTGMALQVAAWGTPLDDVTSLTMVDPPPPATWEAAIATLHDLDALRDGLITDLGRQLLRVPADPRVAKVLVTAAAHGQLPDAAQAMAALTEADPLRSTREVDLERRVGRHSGPGAGRHRREAARLERSVAGVAPGEQLAPVSLGALVATGFPRRLARQRRRGRFTLSSGRGARLSSHDPLAAEEFLVALDLHDHGDDARIHLAAAVDRDEVMDLLAGRITSSTSARWDPERGDVVAETVRSLGAIVVDRSPADVPLAQRHVALAQGVRERGLGVLPIGRDLRRWLARSEWLRTHGAGGSDWPAMDDQALVDEVEDWLVPFMGTAARMADLRDVPVAAALHHRLGRARMARLDRAAPERVTVPSGRSVAIDWGDERGPAIRVKLQEMFGTDATPTVAGHPLVLVLESPAQRPLQITRDLATFWRDGYPAVRAENRGRYPKHPWPEDPLTARPSRRTKRR